MSSEIMSTLSSACCMCSGKLHVVGCSTLTEICTFEEYFIMIVFRFCFYFALSEGQEEF
jgi:hypothetical protein